LVKLDLPTLDRNVNRNNLTGEYSRQVDFCGVFRFLGTLFVESLFTLPADLGGPYICKG